MVKYLMVTNLKGSSNIKLYLGLKITQKSAWHLAHLLREGLVAGSNPFVGPFEVDETHIGSRRKNMSNQKRKGLRDAGCGPSGKAAAVGSRDRKASTGVARSMELVNEDSLDALDIFGAVTRNMEGRRVRYRDLVADQSPC